MSLRTIKEAAEYLNVSVSTVRRLLNTGQLTATRIGRVWRIEQQALNALVQAGKTKQKEE